VCGEVVVDPVVRLRSMMVASNSRSVSPAGPSPASIAMAVKSPGAALSVPIGRLVTSGVSVQMFAPAGIVSSVRVGSGCWLILGSVGAQKLEGELI